MTQQKENKYVDFISDEDFIKCIEDLWNQYEKSKNEYTTKQFFKNKIDPTKLIFDKEFNGLTDEEMISREIQRQIDKTISNFIGHFQEELLGKIVGFTYERAAGYDLKAEDDTLFAEIKNKKNTVNSSSSEATYQKLQRFAEDYPDAKCYWVALIANQTYCEQWVLNSSGKLYNHPRVYKVSGDKFYEILTGDPYAFAKACRAIPVAISDFLKENESQELADNSRVFKELKMKAELNGVDIVTQLYNENFGKYQGFPLHD